MKPFQMSWLIVLHENPDLQQGLLDAAVDTMSAAVVAPLTFSTYFSIAGDANIDHDEDDTQQAGYRHQNINSYCSDEEDDQSSPSVGEEVDDEARDDEEHSSNEDEPPLDSFFLPPFSNSRFFLCHQKDDASCDEPTHGIINTTSDLFWTLHNPAEETPLRIRGAICKAYRQIKDAMDPNKWITITDHLDSCSVSDLVQRQ
jgi:hypothetical protein